MRAANFILLAFLFIATADASDTSCSGTESDEHQQTEQAEEPDPSLKITEIFNALDDKEFITSISLENLDDLLNKVIEPSKSIQESSSKCEVSTKLVRMRHLKDLVSGSITGRCDSDDLRDRTNVMIAKFSLYPNLYQFIVDMNVKHATFCLDLLVNELSETVYNNMRPNLEMLSNMREFAVYYEAKRSDPDKASSSSESRGLPIYPRSDETFLKDTVVGYLMKKYLIELQPDESMRKFLLRFTEQFQKFTDHDRKAFCGPITDKLNPYFYGRIFNLLQIDPALDSKMDRKTSYWLRMMIICERIKMIAPIGFYKHYLKITYSIPEIEQKLIGPVKDDSRPFQAKEVGQMLDILNHLYKYTADSGTPTNAIDVDDLLAVRKVSKQYCTVADLVTLANTARAASKYTNLDLYVKAHIRRQLDICVPKLEDDIELDSKKILVLKRVEVKNLRQKVEKLIDPDWQENKLWKLQGERKKELIKTGLLDYVVSYFNSNYRTVHELRAKVDGKLRSACQEVQQRLMHLNLVFTKLVDLDANIVGRSIQSWMSSFALCEQYLRDPIQWDQILKHLNAVRRERASSSLISKISCRTDDII